MGDHAGDDHGQDPDAEHGRGHVAVGASSRQQKRDGEGRGQTHAEAGEQMRVPGKPADDRVSLRGAGRAVRCGVYLQVVKQQRACRLVDFADRQQLAVVDVGFAQRSPGVYRVVTQARQCPPSLGGVEGDFL